MLQQVSHLAPSAPLDRGLVAGEAMGAAVGGQPDGDDFLALLAQAEGRDGVPPAADVVLGGSAPDQGVTGLATGLSPAMSAPPRQDEAPGTTRQDGDDASNGIVLAGDMKGDGEAGLVADLVTDPANAASQPTMIAQQGTVRTLPITTEGLVQPAIGAVQPIVDSPAPLSQEDVPRSHLSAVASGLMQPTIGAAQSSPLSPALLPQEQLPPSRLPAVASGLAAVGREAAPAVRTALGAKLLPDEVAGGEQPVVAPISDPDSFAPAQVSSQDQVAESGPASTFRVEPSPAYLTGSSPSLMVSPSLPEGQGLSLPADRPLAGAGSLSGYLAPGLSAHSAATSPALPYQRLLPPQLSAQVAPAVLSMGIVPGAEGGPGRLTVAIRPAELGTLQIITERTEDGTARIAVLAERPETLQLLVRDAPTLEAALRAAGVDEGSGGLSLTFGLASQGQGDRGGDAHREAGRAMDRHDGADPKPALIASGPAMARAGLLDLFL